MYREQEVRRINFSCLATGIMAFGDGIRSFGPREIILRDDNQVSRLLCLYKKKIDRAQLFLIDPRINRVTVNAVVNLLVGKPFQHTVHKHVLQVTRYFTF